MKVLHYAAFLLALLASVSLSSCEKDEDSEQGNVTMEFENVVGTAPLQLGSTRYKNAAGDTFTVSTLRYYISNITFKKADGTSYAQPESYYLLDEALPVTKTFTISSVPAGDYTGLTFTIGVDSVRNVSGVQTGALAPSDMFWTWNTGYIFTKLEGRYNPDRSTSPPLVFHIGGFKSPNNTIRTVTLPIANKAIQVREGRTPQVHLKADILKMFTGKSTIRFSELNNVMGGPNAVRIADNQAAGMFTIDHIHGN
ncbi:MbnP family protein [Hymenobacter psychrotolerans]|uniref:Copper-binding protein MbnP-like domain-containing protein n=1 Tax=Hymenobacter psychrotolerans DSM 18569 TaxID=1121959 RepID=A0A1M6VUT6_9BACT|nr:MbnP family protein [Hymenobacter psychrotolerans]SHK85220.1 hypothetical protein SAMN02746009_01659 [Hymenobacter psychrotolerans DSM 18569]